MNVLGMGRARSRAAFGIAAIALAALLAAPAPGAAKDSRESAVPKGPRGLAFYEGPRKLPKGHGTAIWKRRSRGLVPLEHAASNRDLLYTSRDTHGEKVVVSGSVSVPEGRPPKRGWPVISYAHGTTGVADSCAPSRSAVSGPTSGYVEYVNPVLSEFLERGYAVVRTDYQGLGTPGPHAYLIGKAEARSTLDMVRAARGLDPRIGKRMAIVGHSQGGHAALFSAAHADRWTPELRLRGTVAHAPGSHLREQAATLPLLTQPSSLTALATLVLHGAATANRGIDPHAALSDEVLAFLPDLETQCLAQLSEPDSLGGIPPSELIRDGADTTLPFAVIERNNPDVTTRTPILLTQGSADTTVLPVFTDMLAGELEAGGNSLDYRVYDGVDHGTIVAEAQPAVLEFLGERLPAR